LEPSLLTWRNIIVIERLASKTKSILTNVSILEPYLVTWRKIIVMERVEHLIQKQMLKEKNSPPMLFAASLRLPAKYC